MGKFGSVVVRIDKEMLKDLEAVTGARAVSEAGGATFSSVRFEDLGVAKKVIIDSRTSLIIGDAEGAAARALELEIDATGEDNDILKARILERAARLRGKIAIIKVGANSDFAREHKKDKAQDVVKAIPAAAAEGLVQGAGMTWHKIASELGKETIGEQILSEALQVPLNKILDTCKKSEIKHVLDPAKVERVALENAAEAAGIVLTLSALILDAPTSTNKANNS